jgi:hypothetical protein
MLVAEDDVQLAAPAAVEFAEAAVTVAVGVVLAVLLPEQLQRDVTMGLEFLVKALKLRWGTVGFVDAARRVPEKRLFQPGLVPTLGQGPGDARGLGSLQIFGNNGLRDRATAGDLVLTQP